MKATVYNDMILSLKVPKPHLLDIIKRKDYTSASYFMLLKSLQNGIKNGEIEIHYKD